MSTDLSLHVPAAVHELQSKFQDFGFEVRPVGGFVRDLLRGERPADIDLCTDANPDEQRRVYGAAGIRAHLTGLKHGTITVVLDDTPFEVTSLRTESDHDGRWATMQFTRDWIADLSRRDLTANAMAMTTAGTIIDPFGGASDLAAGRVRFVGDPVARMREDHLRILRWLRFEGRLNPSGPLNSDASRAAAKMAHGLAAISPERVWSEMRKIISGNRAPELVETAMKLGMVQHMGAGQTNSRLRLDRFERAWQTCRDAVTLAAHLFPDVVGLAAAWKWSGDERAKAAFVSTHLGMPYDGKKFVARDGVPLTWVVDLLRSDRRTMEADFLQTWEVPIFPVGGADLKAVGMKPGPQMGEVLKHLRTMWAAGGFQANANDLLSCLSDPAPTDEDDLEIGHPGIGHP